MDKKNDKRRMVTFAESADVVERVKNKAKTEGLSVSDVIRRAVRNELGNGRKAVLATLLAGVAIVSAITAEAKPVGGPWVAPKITATYCEHCDKLERYGKILKGRHHREWQAIWANHIRYCQVYKRLHSK